METNWNYTQLATAYLHRPDYSSVVIDKMIRLANLKPSAKICDVGAGLAHLTLMLAEQGFNIVAVEPNDSMRINGMARTKQLSNVVWDEGTGENTKQAHATFDLITFGSSFNVTDRERALKEVKRIATPNAWFACMWNHRDLADPIQAAIEDVISRNLESYSYGARREDQTEVIDASGLFNSVIRIEESIIHKQTIEDVVAAWRSHATLHRQAGNRFEKIINEIEDFLKKLGSAVIDVPYTTRLWMAQLKD